MAKMTIKQTYSLGFIAVASIGLQGCIAAAFPLAAGGLIGERSLSNGGAPDRSEPVVEVAKAAQREQALPEQARPEQARPEQVVNSDLAPVETQTRTASPPASSVSADFNDAFAGTKLAAAPVTERAAMPAPSIASEFPPAPAPAPDARVIRPLPTPVPSARQPLNPSLDPPLDPSLGPSGINQLLSYVNTRRIGSGEEPEAAMLSDRVALEPVKAQCGGVSPTVLIDLDPSGALFDSTSASRPPSGLARGLAQLRANGVGVAWISGNGIDKLDAIKRSLRFSGLDLNNDDRILLVRTPDDRKQTLREELSQISCLVAIAGDNRSDFDELYDYLKNPADAQALEPLIGDGWFLIPQPLL